MARDTPLLGLSERWSLARNNIGSPITVIYHAILPVDVITETDLQNALVRLCEVYPILLYGVDGKETSRPKYGINRSIDPRGLVKMVEVEVDRQADDLDLAELVQQSVKRGSEFDVANGPMLELQYVYPSPSSSSESGSASADRAQRAHLVLIIDHILCDGVGARNLFADLLEILSNDTNPVQMSTQPEGLPARMDDTVDLRTQPKAASAEISARTLPGTAHEVKDGSAGSYLGKVYSQVESLVRNVLPRSAAIEPQPSASTSTLTSTTSVAETHILSYPPAPAPDYNSITTSQQFDQFSLSATELSGLLSMSKNHSVGTVHPTIHIASLIALYRAHQRRHNNTSDHRRIKFTTSIPMSERKEALGHPRSTGNYVIFHLSTDTVEPTTPFWEHARSFSNELRKNENRQTARYNLGKLADIESGSGSGTETSTLDPADESEKDGTAAAAAGDDGEPLKPSKWEDYLLGMVNDLTGPHKLSLAVSNVGIMELPTTGKLAGQGVFGDVYFTQAASAMGACVVLSVSVFVSVFTTASRVRFWLYMM
ncbi:hypothetical protein I317_02393 [Kwoniella heveanensis CBS 569]|nr:hypothetical protein I317_02393 [Kwoniella heveanensis CBS 569]